MKEQIIVNHLVQNFKNKGYKVATDVANIYRCADIALLDNNSSVWVIECKISAIKRALEQTKIHKLSADEVYIALPYKKLKEESLRKIRESDVGLIFVLPNGSVNIEFKSPKQFHTWQPAKNKLISNILERSG